MSVHLHIEHLVLEGLPVDAGEGSTVQAAVEAELTHQLSSGALGPGLRSGGARPSVPAEGISVAGHDSPSTLGRQIGHAVYGGLNR